MASTPSVFDVAAYILKKGGVMTHMKLQKLVYYAQAWSLVWDEKPLFSEKIQAWANGPVVSRLFFKLQGHYLVKKTDVENGDPEVITKQQRETIDRVLEYYGPRDPQWLSDLTHMEDPWKQAREGLAAGERGDREISHATMAWYYGSL